MHQQRGCAPGHRAQVAVAGLHRLARRITSIPGVNQCLYDLTPKPPAMVEYV